MKRKPTTQTTRFFRALKISCILLFCLCLLFAGLFITYEQMQIVSFGEYKRAIEAGENHFRIMDLILYRS